MAFAAPPSLKICKSRHRLLGTGIGSRWYADDRNHDLDCCSGSPRAALAKLPKATGTAARLNAKLVTARFFMERMLPETATRLARIQAGAGSTMELPDEAF